MLKDRYGADAISSSTLPALSKPNVKLANQRHPVTGIPFDARGFPIFDGVTRVEMRISTEVFLKERATQHMQAATRQLRAEIQAGRISADRFSPKELADIYAGRPKIGTLTWHHHQDMGRMQLVPQKIHQQTGHVGSIGLKSKK